MMTYNVQKGDTIAAVSKRLNTNWQSLRKNNPESIGQAKNGNWFLKEGATVTAKGSFEESLQSVRQQKNDIVKDTPTHIPRMQTKLLPIPYNLQEYTPPSVTEQANNGQRDTITHTIKPGDTLWGLAVNKYHVHIKDIMKDNGITDPKTLQVGQNLTIQLPEKEGEKPVVASWYGENFHGRPMANGDIYDMYAATIAHKEMPLGTKVELKNTKTGEMVRAVVTDRGPYIAGRDVDLSYGLAKKLSLVEQGVGNLTMRVL